MVNGHGFDFVVAEDPADLIAFRIGRHVQLMNNKLGDCELNGTRRRDAHELSAAFAKLVGLIEAWAIVSQRLGADQAWDATGEQKRDVRMALEIDLDTILQRIRLVVLS